MNEQTTTPDETPAAFAAYDVTLRRFVGGVHRGDKARDTAGKSDAAKAAKADDHQVEIRRVQG